MPFWFRSRSRADSLSWWCGESNTVEVLALPEGGLRGKGFCAAYGVGGGGEALSERARSEFPLLPSLNSAPILPALAFVLISPFIISAVPTKKYGLNSFCFRLGLLSELPPMP